MADHQETSPLLGQSAEQGRQTAHESQDDSRLLSSQNEGRQYGTTDAASAAEAADSNGSRPRSTSPSAAPSQQHSTTKTKTRRLPTILAITVLTLIASGIILGIFCAPAIVEEYAKQALVLEPTNLSIDSIDADGVVARLQGHVGLDARRVERKNVRDLGRLGTWFARSVKSEPASVDVYLPSYDNLLLGTAKIPAIAIDIRNGHTTKIDVLARLKPGHMEGLRQVANDWLEGRLDNIRITGRSSIALKSGLIPLGTQDIVESFTLEGNDIPSIPSYNITRLRFNDSERERNSLQPRGMLAEASISVVNEYPLELTVPSMNFDILVPGCSENEPYILVANATTLSFDIKPHSDVDIEVRGVTDELPRTLTKTCPHSDASPLDVLLNSYLHGDEASLLVRGSRNPSPDTPAWMSKLLASMAVPVPFPRGSFDSLLRNFSLTDAHFELPDPFADPDTEESNPRISGNILVLAGLPKELNLDIAVARVRAHANVTYKNHQMGVLDLANGQSAGSRRIEGEGQQDAAIEIRSRINNAPLNITNDDVFTDVLERLLFDGKPVILRVDALVEIEVETALGKFQIKDLPAQGNIPVKPIATKGGMDDLKLRVGELRIIETTPESITMQARVNFSNPSEYTAYVPRFEIDVLNNGSILGHTTVHNVSINRGDNHDITIHAIWDPRMLGGKDGATAGRRLLSEYVSGKNTTLTLRTSSRSIPHQPSIGCALMKFPVEIPTPHITPPGAIEHDDGKVQFIEGATFHLLSSTAQFTLSSPLQYTTILIESINATAYHNGTDPIGHVNYWSPFQVPPGISESPRVPVDWSLDSVGYEKVKEALGGKLKLAARGEVEIRLERWTERVEYDGEGIGAQVRL